MMENTVYLDYNATTPLEPDVLSAIQNSLSVAWGNPSSSHAAGRRAKEEISGARKAVADMVNGRSSDIIFTSGGTESNNLVLNTALHHFRETHMATCLRSDSIALRPHFITTNLEHDSVSLVFGEFLSRGIADVTFVPASKVTGQIDPDDVICAIRPTTCMVSVMLANNETGIIQPVANIVQRVRQIKRNPGYDVPRILFHTDAAQAIGKVKVDVQKLGVDYLTIVGHKFYGPRIGALYCRGPGTNTPLHPMFYGGGQERNFRPGTENTGMIAGLGKAAEMVVQNIETYEQHQREIRDYLEMELERRFPGDVHFNGRLPGSQRIPNTCNVSFRGPNRKGNDILAKLQHTQASVGAACHSSSECRASPILLAIGVPEDIALNAVRLSVGRHTTKEDIDTVIEDLKQALKSNGR